MYEAVLANLDENDVVIKSAAVADYKPKNYSNKKIKEGFERRSNASTTNQIDHLIKQAQNKKDKK